MAEQPAARPPLPDDEARRRIREDLDINLMVEAGAGSGKTTSLVDRMVALITSGRARAENIAAVTFTRKATAELRERFQLKLEQSLRLAGQGPERDRLGGALANLDRTFLGTIHSFCSRLLRERPIEAGLDPAFDELERQEDAALRAEVWTEYVESLRLSNPAALALLDDVFVSLDDLRAAYEVLADYPDVEVFQQPTPRPDFDATRAALGRFLKDVGEMMAAAPIEGKWDDLQDLVRRVSWRVRNLDHGEDRHLLRTLELMDKKAEPTLKRWPSKGVAREAGERFATFRTATVQPALQAWREHRHSRMVEAVLPAVDYYAQRRRELGLLNFQDLLMGAAALLRHHPEVRRYFAGRYTHLLIDEFQDTDPIQAEVMFLLTGTPDDEPDWRRVAPRPGSLFVVGDPKQSIYRFRRADIDTYNLVQQRIRETGGDVVRLTTNFRSVQAIGGWASTVFRDVLPPEATQYQAAFAPVDSTRPDGGALADGAPVGGVRTITIAKTPYNRLNVILEEDARRIASWIAWACDGHLTLPRTSEETAAGVPPAAQPGDFLILTTRRAHLVHYARALEALGIPYRVAGAENFAESPEVLELLKLLRAVADPDDPVRLVAALRGLYVGLSDDLLYRYRKAGGWFSFLSPAPAEAAGDPAIAALTDALDRLRQYWQWTRRDPPAVALERIVEDLGVLPYAAGGPMGNSRAGNIAKAMELVRHAPPEETASFADAVDFLAGVLESGGVEEASLLPGQGRAVSLMNLHKAKGLEAPVVFLAAPAGVSEHAPRVHVNRMGDRPVGHFVFAAQRGEHASSILAQPPGWSGRAEEEGRYQLAEEQRLLYVAATRARDLLVISRYEGKPEASPWAMFEPYLSDLPELDGRAVAPVPPGQLAASAAASLDLSATSAAVAAAAEPAYTRVAVTDLTHTGELPPWQEGGGGVKWGSAVHRMLEAAGRGLSGEDLEVYASVVLEEEDVDASQKLALLELVRRVQASELWQRMMQAEERRFEVPFVVEAGTEATMTHAGTMRTGALRDGAALGRQRVLVHGVVDAAFREPDGWVLVDYKTDLVPEGMLDQFVAYYREQIRSYREYWEHVTGLPVKAAVLWFLSRGEWSEV